MVKERVQSIGQHKALGKFRTFLSLPGSTLVVFAQTKIITEILP